MAWGCSRSGQSNRTMWTRCISFIAVFSFDPTFWAQLLQAWNLGQFLSFLFVLFNAVGQLGSVVLVLARVKVASACFSLFAVIASQTVAYSILWDFQFLFRNLALTGALLLVVAESRVVGKSLSYGVPSLGTDNAKTALQLAGRILLVFMFLTLLRFELHLGPMIQNLVGAGLILLVAIGYKTKLSSLLLVTWLNAINFTFNAWWLVPVNKPLRGKYQFHSLCTCDTFQWHICRLPEVWFLPNLVCSRWPPDGSDCWPRIRLCGWEEEKLVNNLRTFEQLVNKLTTSG